MGKCEVCGKEKETRVAASQLGGVSFAYCDDCLAAGLEPYGTLVAYCASSVNSYSELTWNYKQLVDRCLCQEGRSVHEFNNGLRRANQEYNDWLDTQEYNLEQAQNRRQIPEPSFIQLSLPIL